MKHLAYASSIAVFGQSEDYPDGVAGDSSPLHPLNLYGVYKQANEGTARIYWQDNAVSSLGLCPYVVYGAGRDQGLTSGPSKAMLAAALGRAYHIQFGGQCVYQYTRDAARAFIDAARSEFRGAEVLNVRGSVVDMPEIVTADEIPDPQALALRTTVNGVVLQDSNTAEMIFGIRELIAFMSRSFTLEPGDLMLTRTPHGVGVFRNPQVFLKDGDQVVVEVENIGRLENKMITA